MKKQLVVARYSEKVSWLAKTSLPTLIYNKGKDDLDYFRPGMRVKNLYNVGREAHTYLWHILNNWDNLAETTIFTQADPITHSPDFLERLEKNYRETTSLTIRHLPEHPGKWITDKDTIERIQGHEIRYGSITHFNEMGYYFNTKWFDLLWNRLFIPEDKPKDPIFGYGAIYSVPIHRIKDRPKSFYKYIFHETEKYPVLLNAFALEALWYYIWNDFTKYRHVNRFGMPELPPDPIDFTDPVNFLRKSSFPKIMN